MCANSSQVYFIYLHTARLSRHQRHSFMDQGYCVLIHWRYFGLGGSTAGTAVLPPSAFSQAVVPPERKLPPPSLQSALWYPNQSYRYLWRFYRQSYRQHFFWRFNRQCTRRRYRQHRELLRNLLLVFRELPDPAAVPPLDLPPRAFSGGTASLWRWNRQRGMKRRKRRPLV